jgi:DNA-binding MarR family transcriptional regulator
MSATATPRPVGDGIGDQLMELLTLQLRFRRRMQDVLGVDAAGLMTMIHLAEVGSDAHTLEASTAATSLVLNRLEASGHISRQPHPLDRRKVVVMPVAASIASAYARAKPVIGGVEQLTAELTSDERSTVSTFLEGLVAVYDEALRDGR